MSDETKDQERDEEAGAMNRWGPGHWRPSRRLRRYDRAYRRYRQRLEQLVDPIHLADEGYMKRYDFEARTFNARAAVTNETRG